MSLFISCLTNLMLIAWGLINLPLADILFTANCCAASLAVAKSTSAPIAWMVAMDNEIKSNNFLIKNAFIEWLIL